MTFLGYNFVSPVTVSSNQPNRKSTTLNLDAVGVRTPAQRWVAAFDVIDPYGTRGLGQMLQWLVDSKGELETFDFNWPQPLNTSDVDITTAARAIAGATSLTLTASTTRPGLSRLVKFSGHSKVYRLGPITNNVVEIYPALTDAVASGEVGDANPTTKAVFVTTPRIITRDAVVIRATITVQERP